MIVDTVVKAALSYIKNLTTSYALSNKDTRDFYFNLEEELGDICDKLEEQERKEKYEQTT